ncbi:MAG: hypothetical protein ABI547_01435 [Betaproteobacteria bacterium]
MKLLRHGYESRKIFTQLGAPRHSALLLNYDGTLASFRIEPSRAVIEEMGCGAPVAYLGDDAADEAAFAALRGKGLAVLVGRQSRPTAADILFAPPAELIDFLVRWTCARGSH